MSFGLIAVLIFTCLLALVRLLPHMSGGGAAKMAGGIEAFKNKACWKACATGCLVLRANFAAFGYLVPVLADVSEFTMQTVPFILVPYGLASVIGNMVTKRLAYHHSLAVIVVGLTVLSISLLDMALFVQCQIIASPAVIPIGSSGVPMNPTVMARIVNMAHPGSTVNAVHTSAINIGLGGEFYLGGMAISSGFGLHSALWIGVILAALTLLSVLSYIRRSKQGWS